MRHTTLLSVLLAISLAFGCVPESKRGDTFEATLILNTPVFYDGEEFSFTVRSNRTSVKVADFYFYENQNLLTINESYNISDGLWTFTGNVPVKETHRGKFTITLEDPITGDKKTFTENYTAYASTNLRIKIENEIVRSSNIKLDLPLIVGGEDFNFTVYSKADRLILKDYKCKFDADRVLVRGAEYKFKDGAHSFSIPKVNVLDDGLDEESTLSITFNNPDTERDTTITAGFIYALPFEPSAAISPSSIMENDVVTVKFSANRRTFKLSSFTLPSWFVFENLYANQTITLGAENYAEFSTAPISLSESASGELSFLLKDDAYTTREVLIRCPYTTTQKPDPNSVIIDKDSFLVNSDEVFLINVSTNDTYSTNKFHASMFSSANAGKLLFYSPTSGETITDISTIPASSFKKETDITNGKLYVKAGSSAGSYKIKINAYNRPNVYKTASVDIRQDIALRLSGNFYDYVSTDPTNELGSTFSTTTNGGDPDHVGWHGFPATIYADLVTYSSKRSNILEVGDSNFSSEISTSIIDYSAASTPFSISFTIETGAYVTSPGMYESYKNVHVSPLIPDNPDPRYYLLCYDGHGGEFGKDKDRRVPSTMPKSLRYTVYESSSNSSRISCVNLKNMLQWMDCYYTWQYAAGFLNMLRYNITETDHYQYKFVNINIESINYDDKKYHLKYIFNLLEAQDWHGDSLPWFSGKSTNHQTVSEPSQKD